MILDVVLWLPTKVLKRFLRPVTTAFTISEVDNQTLDDYFKEHRN